MELITGIIRYNVKSSNIASIGYDRMWETLEVEFLNGKIYQYNPVQPETYKGIMDAESKGKYFNEHIRSNKAIKFKEYEFSDSGDKSSDKP